MSDPRQTNLVEAFNRVLEARKDVLRSKNNWRVLAEIPKTTALDAFAGRNPTMDTLQKLAKAAQMTVAEMLEYGDPDWEFKVAMRMTSGDLSDQEKSALLLLLRGKDRAETQKGADASEPSA